MKDRMDGKISRLDENAFTREIEAILQEVVPEDEHLKFMGFTKPKPPWYRQKRILARIAIAVLAVLAVSVLVAIDAANHPDPKSSTNTVVADAKSGFPVDWANQLTVPTAKLTVGDTETAIETAAAFNQTYLTNLSNLLIGPVVTVPRTTQVVVVARQDGQPGLAHPAIDGKGQFSQTCLLQASGTLKQIGVEGARELVSYAPPVAHAAIGDQWCTSDMFFYMRMG